MKGAREDSVVAINLHCLIANSLDIQLTSGVMFVCVQGTTVV